MWFGGENVFLLCSQSGQTQHMETFSERPQVCGGKKVPDILFLLPLFIAFSLLFKLIGFHTSARHMWKHPNEYWRFGEGLRHAIS